MTVMQPPTPAGKPTPPEAYQQVRQIKQMDEAIEHYQTINSWRRNGRLALAILGRIEEKYVEVNMTDVLANWQYVAAQAWRGYEQQGRGFLFLDGYARELSYFTPESVPARLPGEIAAYCASYHPRTDLVMAIHGFPETDDPESSACFWLRPTDTWTTPPVAWRQWSLTLE